jgi:hypothetical protein
MFIAMFDRSVPRICGDRLREAIGRPETVYLLSGHYTGFLYLPYAHAKSLAFFKERFGIPSSDSKSKIKYQNAK